MRHALDAEARARIAAVLEEEAAGGVTVVHATHDLDAALNAAHCLVLHAGRLLRQGPPATTLIETRKDGCAISVSQLRSGHGTG